MGYDRGNSFPFDFEPNEIPFGSKLKGNCHHDHIPFNAKRKRNIVMSGHRVPARRIVGSGNGAVKCFEEKRRLHVYTWQQLYIYINMCNCRHR